MTKPGKLSLFEYFAIEALGAFACSIFGQGIFFWAAVRHGYNETLCLLLGASQGLAYVVSARFGGAASAKLGYDRVIQISLAGCAVAALAFWPLSWSGIPFIIIAAYFCCTGPFWPSLEASSLHAKARLSAPQRLGLYNIVWASFGSIGFFGCGFLVGWRIDSVLWVPGLVMAAQLFFFARTAVANNKGASSELHVAHDENASLDAATKKRFMQLHWVGNAIAYFLMTSFNAMLPHFGERLGLDASGLIWLTSSWLFARAASFVLFAWWEGWHYRAFWSLASIAAAIASAAVMFFCASHALVLAACILFGFALGLVYSGSLYYSMNIGDNKGEHGGLHEAILGLGILLGPLAGAGGSRLGGAHGAATAIVGISALLAVIGVAVVNRVGKKA